MKFNLTWGESVAVRQAFLEQTSGIPIHFGLKELEEMDYTPFHGDAKLIEETAKVILRQTGQTYKHIFLTNGASGGCTISLRAYATLGAKVVITNPAPFFPLYPQMAVAAGLKHVQFKNQSFPPEDYSVFLLDSPSNPLGNHVSVPFMAMAIPVIWDSVYHNNVYTGLVALPPKHDVAVGSFSKLTGLNGIRIGWIATNNDLIATTIGGLVAAEYCGLSKPSKMVLGQLLDQFNLDPDYFWGSFQKSARFKMNSNKEEWAKLEKYFGGTKVPINGMFFYSEMDEPCKKLIEKSGILYQLGSKCGTTDDFGRFNIGQDPKIVKAAVKAVLKTDKIKPKV